jgi:hypothetical protein
MKDSMFRKRLIANYLFLSAALVTPVLASSIKLTMSGAITSSNMSAFAVGQLASVSIIYESSSSYQSLASSQAFFVNAMTSLSFTSGAYSGTHSTDPFGVINKYNNIWIPPQPWDGISFAAFSNAGNYTFTTGANTVSMPSVYSNATTQTFGGIVVNLEADHPTVWNDWTLPETIALSEFNANHSMQFGFSGGSFMAGITSLTVENLSTPPASSVPEAGPSALFVLIGLGTLTRLHRPMHRRPAQAVVR